MVSIVIPTHNSQASLSLVLESIKHQVYPNHKIEILIIDGNSVDETLSIASKYNCKLLKNPRTDQVYAKYLGYKKARGIYIMFLDSDEVLNNKFSLRNKVVTLSQNPKAKAAISSGYAVAEQYPPINAYLSDVGDPFTYYMYRDSKDPRFFLKNLKINYKKESEDGNAVVFNFSDSQKLPFIELTSMGVLIDLTYIKKNLPKIFKNYSIHTHLFYLLNLNKTHFAVMKNDAITHYSASNLSNYLSKIKSRIKNNIFGTDMGEAGYRGREIYQSSKYLIKKIIFIPYVFLILPVLLDAILLAVNRHRPIYLLHVFLGWYTLLMIFYFYILKTLKIKPNLVGYGV